MTVLALVLLWLLWAGAGALAKYEIERGRLLRGLLSFIVSVVSVAAWIMVTLL